MSFSKTDPSLFKSSKTRPVSRITVPPPRAFTMQNKDAVASLLSEGREKGKRLGSGLSSGNTKQGTAHHITLSTRGATGSSSSPSSRRQQERIAIRNSLAVTKHQQSQNKPKAVSTVPSFLTGTGGRSVSGTGTATSMGASVATGQLHSHTTLSGTTATTSMHTCTGLSQKQAKERELAVKLQLLQRLRDQDREVIYLASHHSSFVISQILDLIVIINIAISLYYWHHHNLYHQILESCRMQCVAPHLECVYYVVYSYTLLCHSMPCSVLCRVM